jgi:CRP/FNR family nitrogen fixation transcriptional regulator
MVAMVAALPAEREPIRFAGATRLTLPQAARCPFEPDVLNATPLLVEPDRRIIAQGDAAEYGFELVSGCVRTVTLLDDGRRQVGQFLLPGDVFGWDGAGEHSFAAEAVTASTLRRFRLAAVEARAALDGAFARELRHYIIGQVRIAQAHMVLLGRKTAAERIASFLVEMHVRLARGAVAGPGSPGGGVIDLPMNRADIADYLGLTIETVCRGLTDMRRNGIIGVDRSRIVIRDLTALARGAPERVAGGAVH